MNDVGHTSGRSHGHAVHAVNSTCSDATFDATGLEEIDAEVRRRRRAGLLLYEVDADSIGTLHLDLVIAQTHCDVGAVTADDVERPWRWLDSRFTTAQATTYSL